MPPVKRYGSSRRSWRKALPLLSMLIAPLRPRRGRSPGQFQQPLGAASTVVCRFELVGAARAARRPAFDASQPLETETNGGSTPATVTHVNLLWFNMGRLQETFCAPKPAISFRCGKKSPAVVRHVCLIQRGSWLWQDQKCCERPVVIDTYNMRPIRLTIETLESHS